MNSPRFLAQDEDEEDDLVAQRHNIPKHLLGQFLDGLDVDVQAKLNTRPLLRCSRPGLQSKRKK